MGVWRNSNGVALFKLGVRYYQRTTGDRGENLTRSVDCFTKALRFITAEAAPLQYALIQNSLGVAYSSLPSGDRAANLERALECYAQALRFYTAEAAPLEYAATQNNLGEAYRQLPSGDRAANLERAIECYTQALRFYTAEATPLDYAMAQNNLGIAYCELPTGDRSANLERAIQCGTQALRFYTAEATPLEYAMAQNNLGNAYGDRRTGDRAGNLARAIECYTQALRFYTAEAAPLQFAPIQNTLGSAYTDLRTGDRAANVQRAIDCYTQALRFYTAQAAPLKYAMVQNNLGEAYRELLTGDRAANLERAIDCYTQALRFRTAEDTPLDYAGTQLNMGNALAGLLTGHRDVNLARAIDCYTQALRFFTPEADPASYAMALNNLANVYRALPGGDRSANLARAIDCYTRALPFRTAEADPLYYATTQNNLGNAYTQLLTRDRSANLERAIECYTQALRFFTAEADPLNYAATQLNLGSAYRGLPTGDRGGNLEHAIDCYTQALRFYTAEASPLDYALTQNNLGNAYAELLTGNRAANLERAIGCYTQALRFRTADADPLNYAMTQSNMGNACTELPSGDRAANLARAIDYYTQALRFYTPEAAPAQCRLTARRLGDVHFEQDRWAEAHTAYDSAIRAGEFLYQATGSEVGRQAELGAAGDVVAADAYCLARLGRLDQAVERLEAGRARALGEALARDQAALQEASEADRQAFVAAAGLIEALEAEGRRGADTIAPAATAEQSFAELSGELVRARDELTGVIQRIRAYLPGFMGEGLDYPEIAAAASPARPLVYLLTTSRGGLALIVPTGARSPEAEHAVWLDGLTAEQLSELLVKRRPSGEVTGGYLVGQVTGDMGLLASAVTETIDFLRRHVFGPLAERLAGLGAAAATVIPQGRLSLLPLPAATQGCTIALAPSARVLRAARRALRERASEAPVLLAVGNPLPLPAGWQPLRYADLEVRVIERFFALESRRLLPEEQATATAVAQALPGATDLHLACHGGFNPGEPLDSALYLAGGDQITLRDLLDGSLDLSSQRLAVLSACQTGIIEFERVPDEVIGLAAGFLQAGVPGVVATLWPVNDRSTAVLVAEFYRQLAEQADPATALDSARRYLRDVTAQELAEWFERCYAESGGSDQTAYEAAADLRSYPDPADRPYAESVYWAGFVYSGP
jgi:CHAT domain-containing protein/tetratricopeptide (TPR) repeat protein